MNEITSDSRDAFVVLLKGKDVIAKLDPEYAVELGETLIKQGDKVLAHLERE